jgi:hypothetical protein
VHKGHHKQPHLAELWLQSSCFLVQFLSQQTRGGSITW